MERTHAFEILVLLRVALYSAFNGEVHNMPALGMSESVEGFAVGDDTDPDAGTDGNVH